MLWFNFLLPFFFLTIVLWLRFVFGQDRLMTKRMERVKLQADLKKLQSYRSSLDTFMTNLENKDSELNDELENTGKYKQTFVFPQINSHSEWNF